MHRPGGLLHPRRLPARVPDLFLLQLPRERVGRNSDCPARVAHETLQAQLIHVKSDDLARSADVFGYSLLAQRRDANGTIFGGFTQSLSKAQQTSNDALAAF